MSRWTARAILAALATLAILGASRVQVDVTDDLLWMHAPHCTLLALLAFLVVGTTAVIALIIALIYLIVAATDGGR